MRLAGKKIWRLHNLYYIIDEQGKRVKFRPRPAQLDFLKNRHGFDIILKARQLGFSTAVQIDMLDDAIFKKNVNAAIIAQSLNDAEEIFATKIKYPYDNLPEFLRKLRPLAGDSKKALELSNGSKIRVGVSMRSSTLTNLHISEHGKICAKDPIRAKEIKTGSLNTVHAGQKITIESTAEGREGDFYEFAQKSRNNIGKPLGPLDFKFHFYPWFGNPSYKLRHGQLTKELIAYFNKLENELNVDITQEQRYWYTKKHELLGDDIKQEFPSTPDEAFEVALDGTYFATQMALARKQNRICDIPFEPSIPVNTFWDIGIGDHMVVWFHQRVGLQNRFIHYYENSGESFPHYVKYLQDIDCIYGHHYLPHDGTKRDVRAPGSLLTDATELLKGEVHIVPRVGDKQDAIQAVRSALGSCYFDHETCATGIKHLDSYRKEWNEHLGVWRNTPRHDAASHGADAFMTFATGYDPRRDETSMADYEEDFYEDDGGKNKIGGY